MGAQWVSDSKKFPFPLDPEATSTRPPPLTPEDGDWLPVRASMGRKLLSVPRFDQVVIGINGGMTRLRTVHPLDFARIKRELPEDLLRDPLKKNQGHRAGGAD